METMYTIDGYRNQFWENINSLVSFVLINGICPSAKIYDNNGNIQGTIEDYIVF